MFEKVLVPIDFSKYADKIVDCVAEIPGIKEVVLLHVIDAFNPQVLEKHGWSYESLIDDAKVRLNKQRRHLEGLGIKVKAPLKIIIQERSGPDGVNLKRLEPREDVEVIEGGSIGDVVQKTADEEDVDLIFMGAHGTGLMKGMLMGSVSADVLRQGKTNLLIVRHKLLEGPRGTVLDRFGTRLFSKVLLTTDFSEAAEEVTSLIMGLKDIREVALVHVISGKGPERDSDSKIKEAIDKLNLIRVNLEERSIRATVHAPEGHPANEIISLADKIDASLIAMSYQGKGWLEQLRVGSVTFDVAQKANRPVMIVRSASKK